MKSLQDILQLLKAESGKVFVMDETGELQLVIMGVGEYERLKVKLPISNSQFPDATDPDVVNKKIVEAQLAGPGVARRPTSAAEDGLIRGALANPYPSALPPRVSTDAETRDMREEVIDPSFDFDAPEDL